jgi:enediyne biosynthesis protein E4
VRHLAVPAAAVVAIMLAATPAAAYPVDQVPGSPPFRPAGPITCYTAPPAAGSEELSYEEVTGLIDPEVLQDRWGHQAAWADVNNDGLVDLFIGTYAAYPNLEYEGYVSQTYKPDQMLLNTGTGFVKDETFPDDLAWTSGIAFVDLDNDGDLDLVRSRYGQDSSNQETAGESDILRNDDGHFVRVPGAIPRDVDARTGGRSVAVIDYNHDGYQDIFLTQDRNGGSSSSLIRNPGSWMSPWTDVTAEAGLPADIEGFSVGADDFTGDGFMDLFVVGSNRLLVAGGDGTFRESGVALPTEPKRGGYYDHYTGVSTADLNRDGKVDLLIGAHHVGWIFGASGGIPPTRLLINRGNDAAGDPIFTEETGAAGLPTEVRAKSATVHVVDIDNDGHPDILPGVGQDSDTPAYFHNTGVVDENGVPQFDVPANIGTTPGLSRPNEPQAWVAAPVADFDRDGRMDVFLDYFFNPQGVHLQRNTTASGHWLGVAIDSRWGSGPGTVVEVFEKGHLGEAAALISERTISATEGYVSGIPSEARFGLGDRTEVDVRVTLPPGSPNPQKVHELRGLAVDRLVQLPGGCDQPPAGSSLTDNRVDVHSVELLAAQPLTAGVPVEVEVGLSYPGTRPVTATVGLDVPDGWTATTRSVDLRKGERAMARVTVTPPTSDVGIATLVANVTAEHRDGPGTVPVSGWPSLYRVQSVPDPATAISRWTPARTAARCCQGSAVSRRLTGGARTRATGGSVATGRTPGTGAHTRIRTGSTPTICPM